MGTNFKVFNEAADTATTYTDAEYLTASQRLTGVTPGVAISRMHNKMYYQWSVMATAIATFLSDKGYDVYDYDISGIEAALAKSCGLNVRQNSTAYAVGDVAYSGDLKTYLFLECVSAGTSGATIPAALETAVEADTITDGTVVWIVHRITSGFRQPSTAYAAQDIAYYPGLPTGWYLSCKVAGTTSNTVITLPTPMVENAEVTDGTVTWKIRKISSADGVPLGTILPYSINGSLPSGYLECDGSAVSRTMYPDLFAAIGTTYGAGDGSTTFNVPNLSDGKFAEGASTAGTVKQPGLPNITGSLSFRSTSVGHIAYSPTGAISLTDGNLQNTITANNTQDNQDVFDIDASRSSAIYGNSSTVQPYALTTRYIIKAFDGMTADSALIDITQYAQELAGKANITGSNLVHHRDVITTSGTYTAPVTGLYKITVKGGGGGGRGGGSTAIASGGNGGGEGGTTIGFEHMIVGDTASVIIGAGGSGGEKSTSNTVGSFGTAGGNSSITINGNSYVGGGGQSQAGGTGTIPGAPGQKGSRIYGTSSSDTAAYHGVGGGNGGAHASSNNGVLGGGGAGGDGNVNGTNATNGGAGGNGYVWFEYYTP